MDLLVPRTQPVFPCPSLLPQSRRKAHLSLPFPSLTRRRRSHFPFRALAGTGGPGPENFSWENILRSLRRGSERFRQTFSDSVKKETGFDAERVADKVSESLNEVTKFGIMVLEEMERFRTVSLPQFVDWNKRERWKDPKKWDAKRLAALFLYALVVIISSRGIYYSLVRSHLDRKSRRELTEAYMEAIIPEPSPSNIRKFKKSMWRKTMPKGLKMMKFVEGPDRTLIKDNSYIGEDAWDNDLEATQNVNAIIDSDSRLDNEQRLQLKKGLGVSDDARQSGENWRQRLAVWNDIIKKERLVEEQDSLAAKYVVDFDMKEVENSLRKDVIEKVPQAGRALWISKRWWLYRPKLPYTYFLDKLDCSEVAAIVFTENLKKLYVTMKEGFPLEYVVDIPLDPYLFDRISSSCVEVDLLQRSQIHYFLKVVLALLPGLLILYLIRESVMVLHITSSKFLYKKYNQLLDMAYSENFILPLESADETKSMYKEVVLGGDVWDLLDEIMIYMRNPMQYYEKEVAFVRGILLYGPPGTGKTLFARTLAKESGMPFVFASGAEFSDSEKSGAARINQLFSIARRNAPSFVFIDEIDAIAGRHAKKDPRRRATFDALIGQLDGEKITTGVSRFSLRQAVIFICATNRPDELDLDFVSPGRIDRRLYIGLPDAQQRVRIFTVHGAEKKFADDVDFGKLVYRTVGYSGAEIRNLVNDAAIMSVRKGHFLITQQDIVDVLNKQLLEGMGVLLTEEEQQKCEESVSMETKRLLAVHEAGHILLAHLFPRYDWHAFSQLLPGGKETAISVFNPREDMVDQGYTTFGYMKMQMVVAHGGRCAERIAFGDDITDGGKDDLERISKIAREMVISPRNSRLGLARLVKRVGGMDRPDNAEGELIKYRWDDPYVIPADMSLELSELFTRELTRYIEETEEIAMNGLKKNLHILDMITNELLSKSRITGLEVDEKIKAMSPLMFEDFTEPYQVDVDVEGPLPKRDRLSYQPLDIYPAPLHRC